MMELNNSMTGGGGCMSAVRGYEDFELDGKRYRVYGGLNGMTPREYIDSWGKPLTNGDFKRMMRNSKKASSPPKPKRQPKWSLPEYPTRRQPSRSAKEERRMTKGGKRKSHKGHKSRKSHKSHKNRK